MGDLKQEIKQVIVDELHLEGVDPSGINDSAPLFGEGLALDSLDALQLAVAIEEHFGVRVSDEGEGKKAFASIDALAAFITARKGGAQSRPA